MSAGNYIGYFAHLIQQGKMTEEESMKKLEELHKIDMIHDQFDREFFAKYYKEHCQHGYVFDVNCDGTIGKRIGTCSILKGK